MNIVFTFYVCFILFVRLGHSLTTIKYFMYFRFCDDVMFSHNMPYQARPQCRMTGAADGPCTYGINARGGEVCYRRILLPRRVGMLYEYSNIFATKIFESYFSDVSQPHSIYAAATPHARSSQILRRTCDDLSAWG